VLSLETPITVVGDLYGQFDALEKVFEVGGHPPEQKYLFLGNYIDRGPESIRTL
jgi:hypothetical protein